MQPEYYHGNLVYTAAAATPPAAGGLPTSRSLSDGNMSRYAELVREVNSGLVAAQQACAVHVQSVLGDLGTLPLPYASLATELRETLDNLDATVRSMSASDLKAGNLNSLVTRVQELQVRDKRANEKGGGG